MSARPRKGKKMSMWRQFQHDLRRRLLSGLLVIVPLGITAFVLNFLYIFTAGVLAPVVRSVVGEKPPYMLGVISVLVFLAVLYVVGLIATAVIGRRLIAFAERLIQQIPLVKTVYSASKQVVEAFSPQDRTSMFKSAVFVEFPRPGMMALGFLTGRIRTHDGVEYAKVFIPTTPNPTTGFFEIVPPQDVLHSSLNVEDAVKMLMSGGIIAPDVLDLWRGPDVLPPAALQPGGREGTLDGSEGEDEEDLDGIA